MSKIKTSEDEKYFLAQKKFLQLLGLLNDNLNPNLVEAQSQIIMTLIFPLLLYRSETWVL